MNSRTGEYIKVHGDPALHQEWVVSKPAAARTVCGSCGTLAYKLVWVDGKVLSACCAGQVGKPATKIGPHHIDGWGSMTDRRLPRFRRRWPGLRPHLCKVCS